MRSISRNLTLRESDSKILSKSRYLPLLLLVGCGAPGIDRLFQAVTGPPALVMSSPVFCFAGEPCVVTLEGQNFLNTWDTEVLVGGELANVVSVSGGGTSMEIELPDTLVKKLGLGSFPVTVINEGDRLNAAQVSDVLFVAQDSLANRHVPPGTIRSSEGRDPSSAIVADQDGDSIKDILIGYGATHRVELYMGVPSGPTRKPSYVLKQSFGSAQVGLGPYVMSTADFDDDGKPDYAIAAMGNDQVTVLKGESAPGLLSVAWSSRIMAGLSVTSLTINDFNGDRKPDIGVGAIRFRIGVFTNQSIKGWISLSPCMVSTSSLVHNIDPKSLVSGNIDGNSRADVCFIDEFATVPNSIVCMNDLVAGVGGSCSASQTRTVYAGNVDSLAVGDIDQDGMTDVIFAKSSTKEVGILLADRTSATGFKSAKHFSVTQSYRQVAVADLDGDLALDILMSGSGPASHTHDLLYPNKPFGKVDGTFRLPIQLESNIPHDSVALGELENSGKTDIILLNSSSGLSPSQRDSVTIWPNTNNFAPVLGSPVGLRANAFSIEKMDGAGLSLFLGGQALSGPAGQVVRMRMLPGGRGGSFVKSDVTEIPSGIPKTVACGRLTAAATSFVDCAVTDATSSVTALRNDLSASPPARVLTAMTPFLVPGSFPTKIVASAMWAPLGPADLLSTDYKSNFLTVNRGTIGTYTPMQYRTCMGAVEVLADELTGDADRDALVLCGDERRMALHINNRMAGFSPPVFTPLPDHAVAGALGRFGGVPGRRSDVAILGSKGLYVSLNRPLGAFGTPALVDDLSKRGCVPKDVATADLRGVGRDDIIVTCVGAGRPSKSRVYLYENLGISSGLGVPAFALSRSVPQVDGAALIRVQDIDANYTNDLVIVDTTYGKVYTLVHD